MQLRLLGVLSGAPGAKQRHKPRAPCHRNPAQEPGLRSRWVSAARAAQRGRPQGAWFGSGAGGSPGQGDLPPVQGMASAGPWGQDPRGALGPPARGQEEGAWVGAWGRRQRWHSVASLPRDRSRSHIHSRPLPAGCQGSPPGPRERPGWRRLGPPRPPGPGRSPMRRVRCSHCRRPLAQAWALLPRPRCGRRKRTP